MKYAELVRVSLLHPFYADGKTPDFEILASAATRRLLRNHRAILKTGATDVRVLVVLDDAGEPFLAFSPDEAFRFHLVLKNRDFALFTDLTELSELSSPLWTNAGTPGGPLALTSQGSPWPGRPRDAFVGVEVFPGSAGSDTVRELEVAFETKRARWAYYCVTDLPATGPEPEIAGGGWVSFGAANRRDLNDDPDPADRIAVQLAGRYPEKRRIRFLSDELVPCRQDPGQRLELRLGGARVAGPLPTPPIRNHSTIEVELGGSRRQDDSLFQLIRYLKTPQPGG